MTRYIIITPTPLYDPYTYVVDFRPSIDGGMTDSEALNRVLSESDPGAEYSVSFTNKRPRLTRGRRWLASY